MKKPSAVQDERLTYLFELELQFQWEMPPSPLAKLGKVNTSVAEKAQRKVQGLMAPKLTPQFSSQAASYHVQQLSMRAIELYL